VRLVALGPCISPASAPACDYSVKPCFMHLRPDWVLHPTPPPLSPQSQVWGVHHHSSKEPWLHLTLASMTCQDEVYAAMQDERGPDTINQSINQSINQFTFCVLRTHQRSQQTMPMKILRMLSLNETSHSMLLWNAQKFRFCNQTTTSTCI